jgi:hypothetical protein
MYVHLSSWCTVHLENLVVAQLVSEFTVFYGMGTFISLFRRARHSTLF